MKQQTLSVKMGMLLILMHLMKYFVMAVSVIPKEIVI